MKHFLYRITNRLNQRFYVGIHSTENADDGYLGSGRRIRAEVKKYGKENFEKVILEELPSRTALLFREQEVVNEDMMKDPLCLNLKNGGEGGGRFWSEEQKTKAAVNGNRSPNRDHKAAVAKALSTKKARGSGNHFGGKHNSFEGKSHTEETRKKIGKANSLAQLGERNSQFGSCWVTNGVKPVKIKREQLDEYIRNGYSKGRKVMGTAEDCGAALQVA